ncbi:MAG: beta-ketoacyl-[acyl-carrier-protein] synthase family protein [Candidatus Omnitrophota bacterium]
MKVGITGLGVLSAAGRNIHETLETFQQGKRNAGPVTLFPTPLRYPVFEAKSFLQGKDQSQMRSLGLCLSAVGEALRSAGLGSDLATRRVGVCLGTTVASQLNDIEFYRTYRESGKVSMDPVTRYLNGNLSGAVASALKTQGPSLTVVNACTSGADAIGVALSWLRAGLCDVAIAGGADELNRVPLCGFGSLGILSDSLCAPFDKDRSGLNLGEGVGILVLETGKSAHARRKKVSLWLCGYGSANDAHHLTAPAPQGEGLEKAIRGALSEAGIRAQDVSFVNAHGTATQDNDRVEGAVLSRVFGKEVPFYSTKGFTGHTLGAAGGLEAAFSAAALYEGWIPPCAGFQTLDDGIAMAPTRTKTAVTGHYAVSTSLGFGGNNAALVIECAKSDGEAPWAR